MRSYLLKRLLWLIPTLVGITLVSFVVIHLAPGTPAAAGGMDPKMSSEAREKLTRLYGLDKPLPVQYADWVTKLLRLDLGRSFADGAKVTHKIAEAVPVTLGVNLLALALSLIFGIWLGVYGAVRKDSPGDRALTAAALAFYAMPTFWLSLLLISFFGVGLRLLPVSGLTSVLYDDLSLFGKAADIASHLVLPVLVLTLVSLAGISRFIRAGMLYALSQNYVRTARAKGLPERTVVYKHALRNALLPVITILGLSVPGLLGGSVVLESIFSIPGMGRLFYGAVFARDYPLIMGILVLGAVLTLLGNLAADIAYRFADPRLRAER